MKVPLLFNPQINNKYLIAISLKKKKKKKKIYEITFDIVTHNSLCVVSKY